MSIFGSYVAAFFLAISAWFGIYTPTVFGPIATSTPELPVACTMEAKICPDGSAVGRTGPDCSFAPCPTHPVSAVSLKSISPLSGVVGATVTLKGSGFTSDNTILFGSGAIVHVASNNGTTLTFSVPESLNPLCYYSNPRCLIVSRMTTPGDYVVSVKNANGTSNSVTFTVTTAAATQDPIIYSITPTSGPVGTTIAITGFGFTSDNIVHFGAGAIAHIPVSSSIAIACTADPGCQPGIHQTLEFTIPSSIGPYCPPGAMCPMFMQLVTPGDYKVYVQNDNGSSNAMTFTVMGNNPPASTISITGLDAPASLALGQSGTWTVHATVPDSVGQLHYSVMWGDEAAVASQIMYPGPQQVQTSASFTHAYQHSGTYTATFTVSDDNGHSAQVTSTVTVTPLYYY